MRFRAVTPAIACFLGVAYGAAPTVISVVHTAALAGNFVEADRQLKLYKSANGVTPEYIEALSWIGRGELKAGEAAAAEGNAGEVRKLCEAQLAHRKLDAEPHLPTALGASIEVIGQALGMQNRRDEAVSYLRNELKLWQGTSIVMRIQKNVNLLTLEGKPAPVLDVAHGIGDVKPLPLAAHRGHPVLLFLWAHWCPDCKGMVADVQRLMAEDGPHGLVVVAPTQHYGYVAQGKDASPEEETRYIGEVFAKFYSPLGKIEVPLSEENFKRFGVSTTPTVVLVDGKGIVRLYNPGAMDYASLSAKIRPLL
ncbi:MAG TPA: TlpA disulfide reductase family protein [Bryobacteraceae bacterium]|jgi:thiol-disulfide isomerase/thioredoxin|nr:TlpA disulfide reductase family protein [Bryobacteraceae bacterium]